jgi:tRNA A37 N6-isopentenylltransferase MiaA
LRPGPFRLALRDFKSSLAAHQLEEFNMTDLESLNKTLQKIQNRQATEKKLVDMRRLKLFLEGMEGCGKVIETFLNTSKILCFVWVRCSNLSL